MADAHRWAIDHAGYWLMAPRLNADPTEVVISESESEEFRIFRSCIATGVSMGWKGLEGMSITLPI